MVRVIGDIWPAVSGSSSLGVDQTACCPIGEEIRPFNHVHMNSGVFHDPLHGQSGVLRFNLNANALEVSVNGGKDFEPIRAGDITLQDTYDAANEVDIKVTNGMLEGILLTAGRSNSTVLPAAFGGVFGDSYMLATSGFSETPNDPSTAGRVVIGSNGILILGSGLAGGESHPAELFIGSLISPAFGFADNTQFIVASGLNGLTLAAIGGLELGAVNGPMTVNSNSDSIGISAFQNITLEPFDASGALQYRMGPHQAWSWKPTFGGTGGPASDGFFPLPHSGQIIQMIAELGGGTVDSLTGSDGGGPTTDADITLTNGGGINIQAIASDEIEFINTGTLQRAYDNGQTIFINGAQDLQIAAGAHKFKLGTNGDKAEINMSGLLTYTSTDLEIGDMNMLVHSQEPLHGGVTTPTTLAESQALSLGVGRPVINTGSGIVPVMICSGVSSFFNVGTQTLSTSPINVNFNTNGVPDGHFISDSNDDILILVPGLYKVMYAASTVKTLGGTRQQVDSLLNLNGQLIFGSLAHSYMRNATNENKGTANGVALFDADAGDVLTMVVVLTNSPASNTVTTENRAANLVIEYMGPKRGLTTVNP